MYQYRYILHIFGSYMYIYSSFCCCKLAITFLCNNATRDNIKTISINGTNYCTVYWYRIFGKTEGFCQTVFACSWGPR